MSSTDWEKLKDNLEPAARNYYFNPDKDIQLSIAISLKRIADVVTKQPIVMPELTPEDEKRLQEEWNKSTIIKFNE